MIKYRDFDMVINRKFINPNDFYKQIINHWVQTENIKSIEKILIYSDDIKMTEKTILNIIPNISTMISYKRKNYHNRDILDYLYLKDKVLNINIQPIDTINLEQRGIKCAGVIIDVEDKKIIDEYLKTHKDLVKFYYYLTPPTNLNIGLVLYY